MDRTPPRIALHIGGREVLEGSGGTHTHISAVTGEPQAEIPLAGTVEIEAAVEAAQRAFPAWRACPVEKRRGMLLRLAELITENAAEFGRRATLDIGTPIRISSRAPIRAAEWFAYYAGWIGKHQGRVISSYRMGDPFSYTLNEPYGVVGAIITWNGPLTSLGMKVGPALAAGNCVVVKTSELTPFAPDLFARLVKEAGIPDGVVSVMPGTVEAGEALVRHPLVKKISFTGGPETAKKILADCAVLIKPCVLELGGKSANIVLPDADIETVCGYGLQNSIVSMSGQGCAYPTRMLVHRAVYRDVVDRMVAKAAEIVVGDPFEEATEFGPVANEAAVSRILRMISRQTEWDKPPLIGGNRCKAPFDRGFYIEPTIFSDVDPSSELAQKEVFGPVLAIILFERDEEAIAIANGTEYGLSAYIQSKDLARVQHFAENLEAGAVLVNGCSNVQPARPFGGQGLSGYGREGGVEGLDEFLRVKSVALA